MKPIIGLCGPQQNGKSLTAQILQRQGFKKLSLADPLYEMVSIMIGMNAREVDKEAPQERLQGKSVRYTLQTLGTEWGRETLGNDVWLDILGCRVMAALDDLDCAGVVIDDLRFANEIIATRTWGCQQLCVVRDVKALEVNPNDHASEREWKKMVQEGRVSILMNDGDKLNLENKITGFLSNINLTPNHL